MPIGRFDNLKNNTKRFEAAAKYQLDFKKTHEGLYSSFVNCTPEGYVNEFKLNINEAEIFHGRHFRNQYKTNIISFKTLDPKNEGDIAKAHAYSEEVAKRYLGPNAMYIVSTHDDAKHINSHILSSNIPLDPDHKLKNFDTSKRHMNHDFQKTLIEVAKEMDLDITFNETVLEQFENDDKEKYSKVFGTYFENSTDKAQYNVKVAINNAIETSLAGGINTYKDFIKNMEKQGWEFENIEPKTVVRNGKSKTTGQYLKVKIPGRNQFTSLKNMEGFTREDIKSRLADNNINKPDLNVFQYRYFDLDSKHFKNRPEEIDFAKAQNEICIKEMLSDAGDHGLKSPLEWYLSDFGKLNESEYSKDLKALLKMPIPQFDLNINDNKSVNVELKFLNKMLMDLSNDKQLLNKFLGRKNSSSSGGSAATTTAMPKVVVEKKEEVVVETINNTVNQAIAEAEAFEKKKKELTKSSDDLYEKLLEKYGKKGKSEEKKEGQVSQKKQISTVEISQNEPIMTNSVSKKASESSLETKNKATINVNEAESVGEAHGLLAEPHNNYYDDVLINYLEKPTYYDLNIKDFDLEDQEDISFIKTTVFELEEDIENEKILFESADALKNIDEAEDFIKNEIYLDIEPIDETRYTLKSVVDGIKEYLLNDFTQLKEAYKQLKTNLFDLFVVNIESINKEKENAIKTNKDRSILKPFNERFRKIKEYFRSFFNSFEGYIKKLFNGTGEFKVKNILENADDYKKSEEFEKEVDLGNIKVGISLNKLAVKSLFSKSEGHGLLPEHNKEAHDLLADNKNKNTDDGAI